MFIYCRMASNSSTSHAALQGAFLFASGVNTSLPAGGLASAITTGYSPITKPPELAMRLTKIFLHLLASVEDGAISRRAQHVLMQAALRVQDSHTRVSLAGLLHQQDMLAMLWSGWSASHPIQGLAVTAASVPPRPCNDLANRPVKGRHQTVDKATDG